MNVGTLIGTLILESFHNAMDALRKQNILFSKEWTQCYPDLRATGKYACVDDLHGDCDVSSEE